MRSVPARAQRTTLRYVRKTSSLARLGRRARRPGTLVLAAVAVLLLGWTCILARSVGEPFARFFDGDAPLRALAARTAALERRTEQLQDIVETLRADTAPSDHAYTTL